MAALTDATLGHLAQEDEHSFLPLPHPVLVSQLSHRSGASVKARCWRSAHQRTGKGTHQDGYLDPVRALILVSAEGLVGQAQLLSHE